MGISPSDRGDSIGCSVIPVHEHFDKDEVKARLAFLDLLAAEGIVVRRNGAHFVAPCPFHAEGTGSFTIHAPEFDHGHCYGCGWNGDIFAFWGERHGVGDFPAQLAACASLASCSPAFFSKARKQASQVTRVADAPVGQREKPALPRLRALSEGEIEALARRRGLDAAGVAVAAHAKRVGACDWPQFLDRDGCWRKAEGASASWVVTDRERWVVQYRRLDGEKYTRKDGKQIKAWSQGSPTWPLGAGEMGGRAAVLLVEGGSDMLAAFHFLTMFRRLEQVAVCSMLGGSCAICAEALPYFRRRRVRIMMDEDTPRPVPGHPEKPPIFPGKEAAWRWTEQLTKAGATVETFSLAGLVRKDGERVKDLNDLALVDEAAWLDPELRAAFFDFDF